jgi:hypothetical protein
MIRNVAIMLYLRCMRKSKNVYTSTFMFIYVKHYVELRLRNIQFRICCTALVYINTSNTETVYNNIYCRISKTY